ncbi:HDOD domain-containing protein [Desulfurivibrio alkaliphilus]|uniref:Metal dependent phosphohydrolase n=1 Tax=Desulfurivibrio alkaliphilus (strain DSM 19089 / UNIQEM U267 / AHT2) TaxID=589865 RepID=D6Z6L3_DESAT|nr:HDOD domain-containing protein [Desulfurivibrio alkaliphilus]ADH84972.1 metal dependent phosphohydrolase [Desulfurivibrio alkaliphilus AHT 2]
MSPEQEQKREAIRKALREVKNLPTLPGIISKLTKMADDPDTTTEQMGRTISKDHILAAKLLKLVNSAFYGFPQRISSLSSAIILLGFNVIKSLIISASIFELMEDQDMELWEHSLGCAVVCNVLAKRLGVSDPEEVSTAGLIHDLGKVAIKMELPGESEQVSALVVSRQINRFEAERELLGLDHAEVGGWLAKSWNLPAKLVEPISCHHDPSLAKAEPLAAAIVHFADIVIRGMGYGHGPDIWVPALAPRAWELLRLKPVDIDEMLAEVEEKLWDVKGFSLDIKAEAQSATQVPKG